jgi:hypothetical protein
MKIRCICILIILGIIALGAIQFGLSEDETVTDGLNDDTFENPRGERNDRFQEEKEEPQSDSPELFFHVKRPITIDVTVKIPDGITLTIPEVLMGQKATWNDVHISEDGTVHFNDEIYPYLYYEGRFKYPPSKYGWLVEQRDNELLLDNNPITKEDLMEFLKHEFIASGLYENEADVLLKRIQNIDMLDFSESYLAIHYIPKKDVDQTMGLETSHEFSVMRRHFWLEELEVPIDMKEPVFEEISESDYIIHETAVNRD